MSKLQDEIVRLKKEFKRDNYFFLRRRVDKGNGKKTLGWMVKRDDTKESLTSVDFNQLVLEKHKLKELSKPLKENEIELLDNEIEIIIEE